jgi:hypothetical protein
MGELVLRADVAAYNAQLAAGEPHYSPAASVPPPQLTFSYAPALQRWVTPLMDVGRELTCSDAEWSDWQPRSGAGNSFRTHVKADEAAQCFKATLPGRSSAERVLDLGGLLYLARRRRAEGAPSLRCCVWAHELSSPARLLAAVSLGLLGVAGGPGPAAPATPHLSLAGLSPVASQGACVRRRRAGLAPCRRSSAVPRHERTCFFSAVGVDSVRPHRQAASLAWLLACSFRRWRSTNTAPQATQRWRGGVCLLLWCRCAVSTLFSTLPPSAYAQPASGQWNGPGGRAPSGCGSSTAASASAVCDFTWKRSAFTVHTTAQPATGQFSLPRARTHAGGSTAAGAAAGAAASGPAATSDDSTGPDMPPQLAAARRQGAACDAARSGAAEPARRAEPARACVGTRARAAPALEAHHPRRLFP